jgi:hypothetical protein
MCNICPNIPFNLGSICLFKRPKTPTIEWLGKMRGMSWQSKAYNIVEMAILLELKGVVTLMPIKYKDTISTDSSRLSMLVEVL